MSSVVDTAILRIDMSIGLSMFRDNRPTSSVTKRPTKEVWNVVLKNVSKLDMFIRSFIHHISNCVFR